VTAGAQWLDNDRMSMQLNSLPDSGVHDLSSTPVITSAEIQPGPACAHQTGAR